MDEMILLIPRMWGDHHILAVRNVLADLGVQESEASAARSTLRIVYDPGAVDPGQVTQALTEAGFAPSTTAETPKAATNKERRSAWLAHGIRTTQTNRLDLEMSGDFRKY